MYRFSAHDWQQHLRRGSIRLEKSNVQALCDGDIPALIADTTISQGDQRFRDAGHFRVPVFHDRCTNKDHKEQTSVGDFTFVDDQLALCPRGKPMRGLGIVFNTERGLPFRRYEAAVQDGAACSKKSSVQMQYSK
jgi:hypothetical protein